MNSGLFLNQRELDIIERSVKEATNYLKVLGDDFEDQLKEYNKLLGKIDAYKQEQFGHSPVDAPPRKAYREEL